jgi:hypothetical protein
MVSDTMDDVLDDEETEEETEEELNRVSRTLLLKSNGSFCYNILGVSLYSFCIRSFDVEIFGKGRVSEKGVEQRNTLLLLRSFRDVFLVKVTHGFPLGSPLGLIFAWLDS